MTDDIDVTAAVQRIINADASQAKGILAAERPEIQEKVREAFRTNDNLRSLFPEFIEQFVEPVK